MTCAKRMCLAFPGKIIAIENQQATADFKGIQKKINISLVDVEVGDFVTVHAGFAIQALSAEDAGEIIKEFEKADGNNN
ncbi:MAG: hypothetical protein ACD_67C00147G0005 [uncultured bacterium]|nr:MAG: hypothetical protein ACD_67C00147G0005 [uncultured bacterium]